MSHNTAENCRHDPERIQLLGDEFSDGFPNLAAKELKSVDLSVLRQHDAEVRKPLVEALEWLRENNCHPSQIPFIDNVLAKVNTLMTNKKGR